MFGRGPSPAPGEAPGSPFTYPVAPRGEPLSAPAAPRGPRPGGYYLNADGSGAHDANGEPVPLEPDDEAQAEALRTRAAMRAVYQAESMALATAQEIAADELTVEVPPPGDGPGLDGRAFTSPTPRMVKAAARVPPGGSGDPAP